MLIQDIKREMLSSQWNIITESDELEGIKESRVKLEWRVKCQFLM